MHDHPKITLPDITFVNLIFTTTFQDIYLLCEYGKKRKYAKVLQSMQKYEKAEAGCAPGALSGAQWPLPGPSQGHLPGPSQGHLPGPRGTSQGPGAPLGLKQDGLHYDGSGTNCEESSL